MNLREYVSQILVTSVSDWEILTCWGGAGPSYLQNFAETSSSRSGPSGLQIDGHSMRASLHQDLNIWIAWGYPANPDFREDWANKFSDPAAASHFTDFFYGSNLVLRDVYVTVDGGRCEIPLPNISGSPVPGIPTSYTVQEERVRFYKLLNSMQTTVDFEHYMSQCGFRSVSDPWV